MTSARPGSPLLGRRDRADGLPRSRRRRSRTTNGRRRPPLLADGRRLTLCRRPPPCDDYSPRLFTPKMTLTSHPHPSSFKGGARHVHASAQWNDPTEANDVTESDDVTESSDVTDWLGKTARLKRLIDLMGRVENPLHVLARGWQMAATHAIQGMRRTRPGCALFTSHGAWAVGRKYCELPLESGSVRSREEN